MSDVEVQGRMTTQTSLRSAALPRSRRNEKADAWVEEPVKQPRQIQKPISRTNPRQAARQAVRDANDSTRSDWDNWAAATR